MRNSEMFPESLKNLPPETLTKHLISRGWSQVPLNLDKANDIDILQKIRDGKVIDEILIPKNTKFADYLQRLYEAVNQIAFYEDTTLEKFLHDKGSLMDDERKVTQEHNPPLVILGESVTDCPNYLPVDF